MPAKKYRVRLSGGIGVPGSAAADKQTHASMLLLRDESQGKGAIKDEDIARSLRIGSATAGQDLAAFTSTVGRWEWKEK